MKLNRDRHNTTEIHQVSRPKAGDNRSAFVHFSPCYTSLTWLNNQPIIGSLSGGLEGRQIRSHWHASTVIGNGNSHVLKKRPTRWSNVGPPGGDRTMNSLSNDVWYVDQAIVKKSDQSITLLTASVSVLNKRASRQYRHITHNIYSTFRIE